MMKVKENAFGHRGLIFLILIFVFFVLINCFSYLSKKNSSKIMLVGCDEVKILSKLPITDASAKQLNVDNIQPNIIGYAEFSVRLEEKVSNDIQYEIYLEDITEKNLFKYDYIKVYLTNEDGVPYKQFEGNVVPSYRDMRVSLNAPEKRLLLSDKIGSDEIKNFKLRIWVADTYVLDDVEKEFRGKISVKTIS